MDEDDRVGAFRSGVAAGGEFGFLLRGEVGAAVGADEQPVGAGGVGDPARIVGERVDPVQGAVEIHQRSGSEHDEYQQQQPDRLADPALARLDRFGTGGGAVRPRWRGRWDLAPRRLPVRLGRLAWGVGRVGLAWLRLLRWPPGGSNGRRLRPRQRLGGAAVAADDLGALRRGIPVRRGFAALLLRWFAPYLRSVLLRELLVLFWGRFAPPLLRWLVSGRRPTGLPGRQPTGRLVVVHERRLYCAGRLCCAGRIRPGRQFSQGARRCDRVAVHTRRTQRCR